MKTCLIIVTIDSKIKATAIYKIALYIQSAWPFQPKFEIYIFGVMILQLK